MVHKLLSNEQKRHTETTLHCMLNKNVHHGTSKTVTDGMDFAFEKLLICVLVYEFYKLEVALLIFDILKKKKNLTSSILSSLGLF